MSSVITLDFEKWKAQQTAAGNPVVLDEFVFAYVPDLDPSQAINRDEKLPADNHIVHRQTVNKTGLASENAVAYSVTLGTEVGHFDFNWIGLINKTSGVIGMITHAPTQKKIKTANGLQGNVLTRSFLLEFAGAAKETAITTTAETWQIDFTARLSGMDEMQRLMNTDSYGEAAFFEDGFAVIRSGDQYTVKKGLAYVGGLRGKLEFDQTLNSMRNTHVYADLSYQGNLMSQWKTAVKITVVNDLKNYIDVAGYPHYVFAMARVDGDGNVIDLRPKGTLSDRDIADLQKTLGKVQQDYATNSALNSVNNNTNNRLEKAQNGADIPNKAAFVDNIGAYPKTGGVVSGHVDAEGYVKSGDGYDVVSGRDIWARGNIWENGQRVYSPNNKPTAVDIGAYPKTGGVVSGHVDAEGYVKSGDGYDVVSGHDIWARGNIWENGQRVYSPNNKPTAADIGVYTRAEADSLIVPVGVPLPYPHRHTPAGYLSCTGREFDKSLYPRLAEVYPNGRTPDLRGEFIRGWDDSRGIDPGRECGTWQGDAIRNIMGDVSFGGDYGFDAVTRPTGAFEGRYVASWRALTHQSNTEAANTNLVFNASRVVPTANENRPRNIAFNYIVRAI